MRARPIAATAEDFRPGGRVSMPRVLGVLGYDAPRPEKLDPACPFAAIAMPRLLPGPAYEVWQGDREASWLTRDGAACGTDGEALFALAHTVAGDRMRASARASYEALFAAATGLGCPHLVRAYNYLPDILGMEHGEERYRLFNAGRHDALVAHAREVWAAPAACGLGTRTGAPVICCVAGADPATPIENPRQVSAYRYPRQYGPRSPSFSRAMRAGNLLCISGTASIVGHDSLHAGDAGAQSEEILRNLDALLGSCGQTLAGVAPRMLAKIYLRADRDADTVLVRLDGLFAPDRMMVLNAEICRPELDVEIEAFCDLGPDDVGV